jgi:hypothetical protein
LVDKVLAGAGLPSSIPISTPAYGFTGSFGELLSTIISWAIIIGALITLMFILIGGFNYVTAGDDSDKAEGARKTITNGVIGLIIIASAFVLWRLIITLLNLNAFFGV